jgi:hypothetical protein
MDWGSATFGDVDEEIPPTVQHEVILADKPHAQLRLSC